MGVGEADCATCHLEMKGPRCLFPALMLKSFQASTLPPQQDWHDVQALLHICLPEKGLRGCVLAAEGEAQCGDSQKTCWLQVSQGGSAERGHARVCGRSSQRPGVEACGRGARAGQDPGLASVTRSNRLSGFCPLLLPYLPCVHTGLCIHTRVPTGRPGAPFSIC